MGIPCYYYGTEQLLDGSGGGEHADRYIREAAFGGDFGPYRSHDRHVFDETAAGFQLLADVLDLRRREPALRRGRQYLRETSGDGVTFGLPTGFGRPVRGIVAWSRILADREVICAINTDPARPQQAWVTIDAGLHGPGDVLGALPGSSAGVVASLTVQARNGAAVLVVLSTGAFAAYA